MLKDIIVTTRKIEVDEEQSFDVRGLTLTDLGQLLAEYKEPIEKLMEGEVDIATLQDSYPEFMAKVIAMAAEEPDSWETVMKLGFTTQLLAFEACWDLTVPDYDALGKLIQRIKGLIPKSQGKVEQG
jgi:hypothetical protein